MFPPYLSSQKPGEYKRAPWFSSGVNEMSARVGLWWGVGVLVVSIAGGLAVLATRELQPSSEDAEEPLAREREGGRTAV